MKKTGIFKHLDFQIIEVFSLVFSFFVVLEIRRFSNKIAFNSTYYILLLFEMLVNIAATYLYDPFKDVLKRTRMGLISYALIYDILQLSFTILLLFMIKGSEEISRLFIAYEYLTYFFISLSAKLLWRNHLQSKVGRSVNDGKNSLLFVTIKSRVKKIVEDIYMNNYDGYKILGLCVLDDIDIKEYEGISVVCNKEDLLMYACNNWVDGVYFDLPLTEVPKNIIDSLSYAGITTHIDIKNLIQTNYETSVNDILGNSVLSISVKERTNKQILLKAIMDILGGIVGSIITILLTLIIGPIIKIKSPGPIFYKQERIGLNGRHFYMYKFRSMVIDADKHLEELKKNNRVSSDLMFKMENDPRIIPGIGNFIRKSSLDEFPQFFNVLKGDMSLVGTRPPTVDEWNKYELRHRIRMSTKPGITGMWQVSGRNNITDFDEVVRLDAKYIAEWTIGLDIKLIVLTVLKLFKKDSTEVM